MMHKKKALIGGLEGVLVYLCHYDQIETYIVTISRLIGQITYKWVRLYWITCANKSLESLSVIWLYKFFS